MLFSFGTLGGVKFQKLSVFLVLFYFFTRFRGSEVYLWAGFIDKLSFLLLILTLWLNLLVFFCVFKYGALFSKNLRGLLLVLFFCLFCSFFFSRFIGFYIFFEFSLLPLIFIIFGWGYQVERVRASLYLFIYTLVGSLPLLVSLIVLKYHRSRDMWWGLFERTGGSISVFFLVIFFAFIIKLPLYALHLWLPKAHVEAPGVGSIILAAVLLKLRAYGVFRFFLLGKIILIFCELKFMSVLLWGSALSSLICLLQSDLKSLVAYSSIRHMGLMMAGLLCCNSFGLVGVFIVLLRHGFCSSALFFLVNFVYEKTHSRQLLFMRGQLNYFYIVVVFWVLFLFVNFAVPPFLRLLGELPVIIIIFRVNFFFFFFLGLIIFFVAIFCIYVYSTIVLGRKTRNVRFLGERENLFLILIVHFFPLRAGVFKIILFVYLNSL